MHVSVQRGGLGLAGILLALAALAALSARAGGPVSWHVTNGISMLPGITKGTLVVVVKEPSYEIGDVVAYPSQQLDGQVVLHRVVELDGERMVLKGDNNSWLDPERPLPSEALGARVFQVKGLGGVLAWLARPWVLGAGALFVALALLRTSAAATRRRRGRETREAIRIPSGMADHVAPGSGRRLPQASEGVETAIKVGAGCCVLLALAASTGPFLVEAKPADVASRTITWDYTAAAAPGLAYPDGVVSSGDRLYTRLVPAADVTAELSVDVPEGTTVNGTWRLDVAVQNGTGWTRTTSTGVPGMISSLPQRLTTTMPLSELLDVARQVDAETGVAAGKVAIRVDAVLDLVVDQDGERRTDTATTSLSFLATDAEVSLDPATPLVQEAPLVLAAAGTEQQVRLLGISFPAAETRKVALLGAVLGGLALAGLLAARRLEDEDDAISRVAGPMLVPAHPATLDPDQVVDVASFASLMQVATRYERMVLFVDHDGVRFYFVLDDGIAYRYYDEEHAARQDAARDGSVPAALIPQQRRSVDEDVLL